MLQQIIDRRLAGKNKSIGNRERFLRRHKDQIREAVKRAWIQTIVLVPFAVGILLLYGHRR